MQHAVDPVADDQPVFERLDMNVGGPLLQRIGDDQADQPDDRRFGGQILQLLDVGEHAVFIDDPGFDPVDDLAERRLVAAVQALHRGVEFVRQREQRPDRAAGDHRERVDRELIGRIGHRQHELVFVFLDRQRVRLAQKARAHAFFEDGEFRIGVGFDDVQSELLGERVGDFALGHQPQRDQQFAQSFALAARAGVALLQAQRALQRRRVQLAALDQYLAQAQAHGRRLSLRWPQLPDWVGGASGHHRWRLVQAGRQSFQACVFSRSRRAAGARPRFIPVLQTPAAAAAIVASMSGCACAADTKPASNADGAR